MNSKTESDELELIYFFPETKEFCTKNIHILRLIKTHEIRYVLNIFTLYILLDIDKNYFISVEVHTLKITEEKISTNIGYAPSLSLISDEFIVAIGGLNSDTVNLFDLETFNWIYVGKMQSTRYGAYSLYDETDKIVYISGGRDNDQDNTLDVEYFSIKDLKLFEIKVKTFNYGFSLRRSFPVAFALVDPKTFIICGGSGLFLDEDTNTSTILSVYTDTCHLLQDLHNEFSSKNPNIAINSDYVYFFINDNEVIKFNMLESTFISVIKEREGEEEKK